jgi:hypothetical protein
LVAQEIVAAVVEMPDTVKPEVSSGSVPETVVLPPAVASSVGNRTRAIIATQTAILQTTGLTTPSSSHSEEVHSKTEDDGPSRAPGDGGPVRISAKSRSDRRYQQGVGWNRQSSRWRH